ncbi:MAG: hypothetical protein HC866_00785 [Leptolyngbyaceae cyanobacterium RU_5_1]|nr:hypothetical protein [Leptolyngbyaceae cyanobacterium RU_5_1]
MPVQPVQPAQANPATPATRATEGEQVQVTIQELTQKLHDREASIHQLETELHRAHIALQEQQALIDSLQQVYSARLNASESPLDRELFTTHCKVQELETQISKQITTQAMLQHTCQELEQTRDLHQTRIAELEQQTADMQEQILKQAQQTSEYETAIQHWKDRYLNSKRYLVKLQTLVEQAIPDPAMELSELIAAIQAVTVETPESDTSTSLTAATKRGVKMDVPAFLARRQRYRVRSQG